MMGHLDPPSGPAQAATETAATETAATGTAATGTEERQTPLSEAVEQTADTVRLWFEDLAGLAKHQANRVASGHYGLDDLVTGQFDLLRIWVKNATAASLTVTNNLALLSSTPPDPGGGDAVRTRELRVAVSLPPKHGGQLTASDLVGRQHGFRVPASKVTVEVPETGPAETGPAEVVVTVRIDFSGAPNGIYDGSIQSTDTAVSQPFMAPLGEFGEPGSQSPPFGPP